MGVNNKQENKHWWKNNNKIIFNAYRIQRWSGLRNKAERREIWWWSVSTHNDKRHPRSK